MKLTAFTLSAVMMGTMAHAGVVDDIIARLTDLGYTQIEVSKGLFRYKVHAIFEGEQHEIVFDLTSGDEISREISGVGSFDEEDDASGGVDDENDDNGSSGLDNSGSGGGGGIGNGGSGGGGGGGGGGGSGGGSGDSAMLEKGKFNYITGGNVADIEFS